MTITVVGIFHNIVLFTHFKRKKALEKSNSTGICCIKCEILRLKHEMEDLQ